MTLHNHTPSAPQTPQPQPQAPPEQAHTVISHKEMDDAHAQGLVRTLGDTLGYAAHFEATWWIRYEGGWIRTDPELSELLDQEWPLLAGQDQIIARNAQHRSAANPPGSDTDRDPA